jgi:hypothetical protein
MMATEKEWVEKCLKPRIRKALQELKSENAWNISVDSGMRLTYAHEILQYHDADAKQPVSAAYETDLLIRDSNKNGDWVPRVVLECKKEGVTTHDALTYSAKAATHKHVHPYLRYGMLIGALGSSIPGRLIRHGAYFDFMMVWSHEEPTEKEWAIIIDVLKDEIESSRKLQAILTDSRSRNRKKFGLLHRKLDLRESDV